MLYKILPGDIRVVNTSGSTLVVRGHGNPIHFDTTKKFIDDIPVVFKNVKFVVFNVFHYRAIGYASNMNFCEDVKAKLDALHIGSCFDNCSTFGKQNLLVDANIYVKPNEVVLFLFAGVEVVDVAEYQYTELGYKRIGERVVPRDKNGKYIREIILGSYNPKKIILNFNDYDNGLMKHMRSVLRSKKLVEIPRPAPGLVVYPSLKYFTEYSKWLMDKSYTKFHVIPILERFSFVFTVSGKMPTSVFKVHIQQQLPYQNSIEVSNLTQHVLYGNSDGNEFFFREFEVRLMCHRHKITFSIDVNQFMDVQCDEIIFNQFSDLPKTLEEKGIKDLTVIGIMKEMSVICMPGENGYEFLEGWNGLYGRNFVIGFGEEKPIFDKNVDKLYEKETSVVYDLIKIMSYGTGKIEVDETWPFAITNDPEHPVLLEWDNFDGTRKAASPAFLMALLFKQHLKVIKRKLGRKPPVLGICLLDDFDEAKRNIIKEQLVESCEMLKVGCEFIDP